MASILVIDDDKGIHHVIERICTKLEQDFFSATNLVDGMKLAQQVLPDVVFLDVMLPDGMGTSYITDLKNVSSSPKIIVITAFGNVESGTLALELGAFDYLQKDIGINDIKLLLLRAIEAKENQDKLYSETKQKSILGESNIVTSALSSSYLYSVTDNPVLITGETGTGKELFARYIHENSKRKHKSFVAVDCASIPENLAASILFGYEKGAFTDASSAHDGLLKQAEGGTLFLDELGELPPSVQKIFLRILQENVYRPLGSSKEYPLDIRIISATNCDIVKMLEENSFRSDFFYRIQTCRLHLPPLKERKEDILLLAKHFQEKICLENKVDMKDFSKDIIKILLNYPWPGNIRELKNTINYAMAVANNECTLYPQHLPLEIRISNIKNCYEKKGDQEFSNDEHKSFMQIDWNLPLSLHEYKEKCNAILEKLYLTELITQNELSFDEYKSIAGLSRSRLYALLKKYNLNLRAKIK